MAVCSNLRSIEERNYFDLGWERVTIDEVETLNDYSVVNSSRRAVTRSSMVQETKFFILATISFF